MEQEEDDTGVGFRSPGSVLEEGKRAEPRSTSITQNYAEEDDVTVAFNQLEKDQKWKVTKYKYFVLKSICQVSVLLLAYFFT